MKHPDLVMPCDDCGVDTHEIGEYYMVQDALWDSVAPHLGCFLCIGCLEGRINRRLTKEDFTDAPVNDPEFPFGNGKSDRFLSRLGLVL